MSRTLHVNGQTGKAFIYNNDQNPSVYVTPTLSQLGDLHFHSDLSYLGNTQVITASVTHPQRTRSSSSSKWGGTTYATLQGSQSYVIGTNSLGAARGPVVAFIDGAQMSAGTVIHSVGQSIRAVTMVVSNTQVKIFEKWLTFDDNLPAITKSYKIFVFQKLFSASGNTSIYISPGTFKAGFGKLSTDYRYLRKASVSPDLYVTSGKTADVQGGGLKVVRPDGTVAVQSGTYTGNFSGSVGLGVII